MTESFISKEQSRKNLFYSKICQRMLAKVIRNCRGLTINRMTEHHSLADEAIPLPNVNGRTLEKVCPVLLRFIYAATHKCTMVMTAHVTVGQVLEFCKHHKDDPPTEEGSDRDEHGKKRADDIEEWDSQFISVVDNEQLFDIILAANYMDIKPLLELGCKSVANMIKGKVILSQPCAHGIAFEQHTFSLHSLLKRFDICLISRMTLRQKKKNKFEGTHTHVAALRSRIQYLSSLQRKRMGCRRVISHVCLKY